MPLPMRPLIVVFFLALSGHQAAAQVSLGMEAGPDAFFKSEEAGFEIPTDDAFAWALSAQISSATLYSVFESTAGEREILKYLRSGLYRQELITLILISGKTTVPFSKLAAELSGEGTLRSLAKKHGVDLAAAFSEAEAVKAAADLETPLFAEPSPVSESSGAFKTEISTGAKP